MKYFLTILAASFITANSFYAGVLNDFNPLLLGFSAISAIFTFYYNFSS